MTLKHIEFNDSPVMRELARQAIKDGTISRDLSTMVKMAAAKKENVYAPSNNLFDDMVCLADGLRSKGMVRDAQILEQKILAHKLAQVEVDKLLDEAHPEGAVEVAESDDDFGVIETLESRHERIMSVVAKKPTGKQAMIASILDVAQDILKNAQAVNPKADSQAPSQVDSPSMEEMESEVLGINAEKVENLNSVIAEGFAAAKEALSTALSEIDYDKWKFHPQELLANDQLLNVYAETLKDSSVVKSINKYKQMCQTLFGKFVYPGDMYPLLVQTLKSKITSPDEMRALVNSVSPDLLNYVTGLAEKNEEQQYNPNSIWEYAWPTNQLVLVPANFSALTNAMYNKMRELYVASLGDEKLTNASNVRIAQAEEILAPLRAVTKELSGEPPKLSQNAKSALSVVNKISKYGTLIQNFSSTGTAAKKLLELTNVMWPGWTPGVISTSDLIMGRIRDLVAFVNENAINQNDVLLTEDMIGQLLAPTKQAVMNLVQAYKASPENSAEKDKYKKLGEFAFQMMKIIEKSAGKPFFNLSQELAGLLPAKSFEELLGQISTILQNTSNLPELKKIKDRTVSDLMTADDGMNKAAQKSPFEALLPKTETKSNVTPPSGNQNNNQLGKSLPAAQVKGDRIQGTLTQAERDAVLAMQAAMVQLGKLKNKPEWQKVGKKESPTTPDGAWGPGTAGILADIQNSMKQDGMSVTLHTRFGGHENTVKLANENTKSLQAYIAKLGGSVSDKPAQMLGTIPSLNEVTIWDRDLISLTSLYDMLKRAGVQENGGVTSNNEQYLGIPFSSFYMSLYVVWQTIKQWYDSAPKEMATYYQAINARFKELVTLAGRFKWKSNDPQSVVSKSALQSLSKTPGKSKSQETGVGYIVDPTTGKPVPASGQSGSSSVGDGEDIRMNTTQYPFPFVGNGDIDVAMSQYYGPLSALIGDQVLSLQMFRARGSKQLAYAFFADKADAHKAFDKFLNGLSRSLGRAVRFYSYGTNGNRPLQSQRNLALDYNTQWQEAIQVLKDDLQSW